MGLTWRVKMKSREYLKFVGRSKIIKSNDNYHHPKTVRPFVDIYEFKGFEFVVGDESSSSTTLYPVMTIDSVKMLCPTCVMLYDDMTNLQIEQFVEKIETVFRMIDGEFVNNQYWVIPQYIVDAYADAGNLEKVETLTKLRNQRIIESEKRIQERNEIKRLKDEQDKIEALELQKSEQDRILDLFSKIKDGVDTNISNVDLIAICDSIGMRFPIRTKGFMNNNLVRMNFGQGTYAVRKKSQDAASNLYNNIKSYIENLKPQDVN